MNDVLIPGIFNYCDRWCERCTLTAHCAIFEAEEDFSEVESDDFFHLLENILDDTLIKVEAIIQSEAPELWNDWQAKIADLNSEGKPLTNLEEDLILLSRKYFMTTRHWLKTNKPLLDARRSIWCEQQKAGMDQGEKLGQLEDALAVIQWYQAFISAKVQRAIKGKNSPWQPAQAPFQSDANGSAKVALLAIDRSLSAWELIRKLVPETIDDMLDLLVLLSKLKSGMQGIFPKTDHFIRPGFDELGSARSDS